MSHYLSAETQLEIMLQVRLRSGKIFLRATIHHILPFRTCPLPSGYSIGSSWCYVKSGEPMLILHYEDIDGISPPELPCRACPPRWSQDCRALGGVDSRQTYGNPRGDIAQSLIYCRTALVHHHDMSLPSLKPPVGTCSEPDVPCLTCSLSWLRAALADSSQAM